MSAKLSLNKTNSVRWENANPSSQNHGKTLTHVARSRIIPGNGYSLSGSTKLCTVRRRERPGCSESEHIGSLVKSDQEMDEMLFYNRSQHCISATKSRICSISGVLVTTRPESKFRNLGSLR